MKIKIGTKLKEIRKENNLTQQQVADKLNISRVNYTRYETDVSCPDFDVLVAFADLFDVSIDYIFNREKYF